MKKLFIVSLVCTVNVYADPISDALTDFSTALQRLGSGISKQPSSPTSTGPQKPPLPPRGKTPVTPTAGQQAIEQHLSALNRISKVQNLPVTFTGYYDKRDWDELLPTFDKELNFFANQKTISPEKLNQARQLIDTIKNTIAQQLLTLATQAEKSLTEEEASEISNTINNYLQIIIKTEYMDLLKNIPQSKEELELIFEYYAANADNLEKFLEQGLSQKYLLIPLSMEILGVWTKQIDIFSKALVFFKNNESQLKSINKWDTVVQLIQNISKNTANFLTLLSEIATTKQNDIVLQYINDFYTKNLSKIDFVDIKSSNDIINNLKKELSYKPSLYTLEAIAYILENSFEAMLSVESNLTSPILSAKDLNLWKTQIAALREPMTFITQNPPHKESRAYTDTERHFDEIVNNVINLLYALNELVTTQEQAKTVLQYIDELYTKGVGQNSYRFMPKDAYKNQDKLIEELKTELNTKFPK